MFIQVMHMPRSARRQSETGIFHVMLRGINRADLFQESEDYERFIDVLRQCKSVCGFELFAWCLMGNHVHLLIRPGREPLSLVMKRIGCRYVYWYNRKYERVGHLFQDRYRSEAVETDAYFLTVLRYILQNPIKAGLEPRMGEYPYSSFKAYAGTPDGLTDARFALGYIEGRDRLIEFLTAPTDEKALDAEPVKVRISDADILSWVNEIVSESGKASFSELEKPIQRAYLQQMIQRGATIRQIAAAAGLPKSNVARLAKQ